MMFLCMIDSWDNKWKDVNLFRRVKVFIHARIGLASAHFPREDEQEEGEHELAKDGFDLNEPLPMGGEGNVQEFARSESVEA